ncbi:MAG: N-acetylglucosamine-6-phosphate deacetylase [Leptolyngbyaceae cyanobacterium bins.59]|nr:N-acetylglucosamine-6-phosphate deacetylase [Leptolyngbyaceae cyanobacterium bins.59]
MSLTDIDSLDLVNARLVGHPGIWWIRVRSGVIEAMGLTDSQGQASKQGKTVDLEADWISPGGVDLQINGALGLAFPDLKPGDESALLEISRLLWQQGVEFFLPTIVTTSVENIHRSLAFLSHFKTQVERKNPQNCARILGVHLEGPFLNFEKRGAHPPEYLLPLTLEQVKRVLGEHGSIVTLMTLAPELDETGQVIPYLKSLGMTVSLGHSQATAAQASRAFEQGASMVTHAFNAMPGLHHREPGLLGAAIVHPHVYCGLIADGQHVSPTMLDLLLRASDYERGIFLVSDALSPLGLPDGFYPWDTRQIEVRDGTARLPDGTLSGTTLSLLAGTKNLVKWGICAPERAIALATLAPRRALGIADLAPGQPAHLLRWRWTDNTQTLDWQWVE